MSNKTDEIASKYLGKKVNGSEEYNSSLLVAVPREENRKHYNIENNNLPFLGYDVWHAYEFSTMTANGIPVTRLLKLKYDCNNDYIIESKSLKLYFNSFNMSKFGNNIDECLEICKNIIAKDLSKKLKTNVDVNFLDDNIERINIFSKFRNIMENINQESLKIEKFKESPELIKVETTDIIEKYYLKFDSLRSNCRVTHQPDFGDVFIYYKSVKHINESSLVKYLTSFRTEYHFHEECCEMIFKRLYDILDKNDELFVSALYTRRGGIDISPVRWSKTCTSKHAEDLIDITKYARCGIKQ